MFGTVQEILYQCKNKLVFSGISETLATEQKNKDLTGACRIRSSKGMAYPCQGSGWACKRGNSKECPTPQYESGWQKSAVKRGSRIW